MAHPTAHRLLVPVLLVPTFMGFLDLWIVLVALPSIRAELGAGVGAAQLVVGMYLTTYGAALVLGGRLGDDHGRRRVLGVGVATFTAASALCAAAPDPTTLVLARAVQGLGAALMLPQVLSIIQVAVPVERRTAAIGAYTSVIGVAVVSGLVLGGTLLQADVLGLGWRVLFAINVPIGLAALVALPAVVPESRAPARRRLDVRGAALLGAALVVGLLSLVEGPDHGWPAWTVAGLVACVAAGVAFARVEAALERRGGDPLVPPRVVAEASVRIGLGLTVLFYVANSGLFLVLPLFFSAALGLGPLGTGLTFAPLGVAFVVTSLASRRAGAPTGPRPMAAGAGLLCLGLVGAIATATHGGGPVAVAAPLVLYGLGSGVVYPRIVGTALARVPVADAGAASGVLLTATQVANALGVAVVGGVWSGAADRGPRDAFALAAAVVLGLSALLALATALLARRGGDGAGGDGGPGQLEGSKQPSNSKTGLTRSRPRVSVMSTGPTSLDGPPAV